MSYPALPCAVSLDLARHMAAQEEGERAAEATEQARADRKHEILASADLLDEAVTQYGDIDAICSAAILQYLGQPNTVSDLLDAAAEAMANAEVKELTPADLKRVRDEVRAEMAYDERMEREHCR